MNEPSPWALARRLSEAEQRLDALEMELAKPVFVWTDDSVEPTRRHVMAAEVLRADAGA